MKNLLCGLSLTIIFSAFLISCDKNKNYYAVTDYTSGMLTTRHWTGYAYGFAIGDTVIAPDTLAWPKYYYRNIDTSFNIQKVNSFAVSLCGMRLVFRSVDSVSKIVTYDSTYANSQRSFLIFDYGLNTMRCELHKTGDYNAAAGKAYSSDWVISSL